jgi:hypothetical protein
VRGRRGRMLIMIRECEEFLVIERDGVRLLS